MTRLLAALAAFIIVPLVTAAPSRADDASYMAAIRDAGMIVYPGLEAGWLGQGHQMCNELREGRSVAAVSSEVSTMDPAVFMPILQNNLCPDTLSGGS